MAVYPALNQHLNLNPPSLAPTTQLSFLCGVAELFVVAAVGGGFVFQMVDKYVLKHDPPRNPIE